MNEEENAEQAGNDEGKKEEKTDSEIPQNSIVILSLKYRRKIFKTVDEERLDYEKEKRSMTTSKPRSSRVCK